MRIIADFKCNNCKKIYESTKKTVLEDFPKTKCPNCGSEDTFRIYNTTPFSIAEGKSGNSQNGYSSGFVYHPNSMMGRMKGKQIK